VGCKHCKSRTHNQDEHYNAHTFATHSYKTTPHYNGTSTHTHTHTHSPTQSPTHTPLPHPHPRTHIHGIMIYATGTTTSSTLRLCWSLKAPKAELSTHRESLSLSSTESVTMTRTKAPCKANARAFRLSSSGEELVRVTSTHVQETSVRQA